MAYIQPNISIVRPPTGARLIHRRVTNVVGAAGGNATGVAAGQIACGPGRLVAVSYGKQHATDYAGQPGALTSGALTVKADTSAGVQIFADSDLSSVPSTPTPVGTAAVDEGGAATAATDGFSGGFPIRSGLSIGVASGTDDEIFVFDAWIVLDTYVTVTLIAQSGADGSGAVTRFVPLNQAGVLVALAIDYQNTPATADLLIKSDSTNGPTLFTRSNSNTDLAPTLIGRPGADEGGAATAATDGTQAGNAFKQGLFFDLAQTDAFTSGDEKTVIELWIQS